MAESIREYLAAKLHEDRDHTREGCELGNAPWCNCYALADKAIEALGGVKTEREFGTYLPGKDPNPSVFLMDFPSMKVTSRPAWYVRERLGFATEWEPEPANKETP